MKRPDTPVPIAEEAEQQRLKEESEKARQSHPVGNPSAEIAARTKRQHEKKDAIRAEDR